MADVRENQMAEDGNPAWIRTMASDGTGKKTSPQTLFANSKHALKKISFPTINSRAVKVATINAQSTGIFANVSFLIRGDMFQMSFFGIIGVALSNGSISPFFKGLCQGATTQALFVKDGNNLDVYIKGTYGSSYQSYGGEVWSMSERVSFDEVGGSSVLVSSLTPAYTVDIK